MVPDLPTERVARPAASTHPGPPAQALSLPKTQAVEVAAEGSAGLRPCDGSMDAEACGPGDRARVRRSVSPLLRVDDPGGFGVELSEAGVPGPGAGREGHPAMAQAAVAAYKKTPEERGVASSLLTKAASCCNRWCDGPGPREGRRRFNRSGSGTTDFRSSARSPLPRGDVESGSTGRFADGTSVVEMWWASCGMSGGIFAGASPSSWTAGAFTRGARFPELNPAEQVWNHSKYSDLANFSPADCDQLELHAELSTRKQRVQSSLLRSLFKTAELPL